MTEINTKKTLNLSASFLNYQKIIDKDLPNKFKFLDSWLYQNSNKLLFETERKYVKYKRYPRGTIIRLDFGVNIGCEFSLKHFAIVLSKKDTIKNDIITVMPLTSKIHENHTLKLTDLIVGPTIEKLIKDISDIQKSIDNLTMEELEIKYPDLDDKIKKMEIILGVYSKYNYLSNAVLDQVTTVSKLRILPPINEYDIVGSKCSDEIMKKIDYEIVKRYTGFDYRTI